MFVHAIIIWGGLDVGHLHTTMFQGLYLKTSCNEHISSWKSTVYVMCMLKCLLYSNYKYMQIVINMILFNMFIFFVHKKIERLALCRPTYQASKIRVISAHNLSSEIGKFWMHQLQKLFIYYVWIMISFNKSQAYTFKLHNKMEFHNVNCYIRIMTGSCNTLLAYYVYSY